MPLAMQANLYCADYTSRPHRWSPFVVRRGATRLRPGNLWPLCKQASASPNAAPHRLLNPKKELPFVLGADNNERPADAFIPNLFNGNAACIDFANINCEQPKYLNDARITNPIDAMNAYCKKVKEDRYEQQCNSHGLDFFGAVGNIYGCWTPKALSLFRKAARLIAAHENIPKSNAMNYVMTTISVTLMKKTISGILARSPLPSDEIVDNELLNDESDF